MSFHEAPHLLAAGVLWAVVLVRWRTLRRPGAGRVLQAALACLGAAELLQIPTLYDAIGRLSGNVAAGSMLKLVFTLGAAVGVRTLALGVSHSASSARRDWVVAAVTALVVCLPLVVAPPAPLNPALRGVTEFLDTGWRSLVHWLPFLAYLGWALGSGALLCWRFGRQAPAGPLRTGLALIGSGCALGGVYVGLKLAVLVAWHTGGSPVFWLRVGTSGQAAVVVPCILLIAFGSGWESVARWTAAGRAVVRLRRLTPLWRAVVALEPSVALGNREVGVRYRLRRRVVEIRDGLLALEERVADGELADARRAAADAGLGDDERDAAIVAALLRRAVSEHRTARQSRVPLPLGTGDSYESEVQWLLLVARHLTSSPAPTVAPARQAAAST